MQNVSGSFNIIRLVEGRLIVALLDKNKMFIFSEKFKRSTHEKNVEGPSSRLMSGLIALRRSLLVS